ncbi:MAG: disulfide bond formation protein B [Pseudomonadota bacterium]
MAIPGAGRLSAVKPEGFIAISLVTVLIILALAIALERVGGMTPCPLCLEQRAALWWAAGFCAAGLIVQRLPGSAALWVFRGTLIAATAAFAWSAGLAAFHIAVENGWATTACSGGAQSIGDLLSTDQSRPIARCDETAPFLGISLAVHNFVFSSALALFVSAPLWRERLLRFGRSANG